MKNKKRMLKLNILLSVSVLLIFNTFAWFIYTTTVSNTITTKVKAWRIDFANGEDELIEYISFDIDNLYPGMNPYHNEISIANYGETSATISFQIVDVRILDEVYDSQTYTHEQLLAILENNFPFSFEFFISSHVLNAENGSSYFTLDVNWPFESGDDELDTFWGQQAYAYIQENPGMSGIHINVKLTAIQSN